MDANEYLQFFADQLFSNTYWIEQHEDGRWLVVCPPGGDDSDTWIPCATQREAQITLDRFRQAYLRGFSRAIAEAKSDRHALRFDGPRAPRG